MDIFRKFTALIITVLCLGIVIFLFLKHLASVSLPDNFEEGESVNLKSEVKIFRNQYGRPHIIAENENDLFAQDRLWQMDYYRRLGRGQLSEIFGINSVKTDKFMRAIGIEITAKEIEKSMNQPTLNLMKSYSDGINFFIEKYKKKLPYEFCVLNYTPYNWTPEDCIIIQRVIALELSVSFWADLTMGAVAEKIGPARTLELISNYPDYVSCVLDSAYPAKPEKKIADNSISQLSTANFNKFMTVYHSDYAKLINQTSEGINKIYNQLRFNGNSKGSNAWGIRKSKKVNTYSVIANDSHFPLGLPAQWYQVHLTCPTMNVIGMSQPGLPFVLSGRNNYIAWGYSNMNIDDCDYFIEKIDSDTNYYYNSSGNKIKFNYIKDTIKVRNKGDYVFYRKYTQRSAVLSDYEKVQNPYNLIKIDNVRKRKRFINRYCITFNWTGNKKSNELDAVYKINKSKNWYQFKDAVKNWCNPAVSFIYGDKTGNIGLVPSGFLPVRDKDCKPQIPNPDWLPGYDWTGLKNMNEAPCLFNPIKKFVSSANNKVWRYSQNYLSSYWGNSSRIQRIDNLLNLYDEYNSREAQIMQMDIYSNYARELLNSVIPIIQKNPEKLNELERQALRRIKKWDCLMSQHTASPMIFSQFVVNLIRNTFADELGENLYKQFISVSNISERKILDLVADTVSSSWFDNAKTPYFEDKYYIVQKSFKDAVNDLKSLYDSEDINLWKFGKNNVIELKHILSDNEFIKPAIDLGKFESNGSNSTINTMDWNMSEPYKIVSGPSMRLIADMGDTVVYTSIAGGISGDPFSDNYSNQVQLWLNGGYVTLPVSIEPGISFKLKNLLIPKKPD
ncbi:MAG: penicillin acylase family protein [Ignavibacteriae bacterium]|nr:penicillin acylase family protein [Ignavibacteriota bacterium]